MAHPILSPTFERRDDRGLFCEIVNGFSFAAVSRGRMRAGAVMGNHFHKKTRVFFFLVAGGASVRTVDVATGAKDAFRLSEGEGVYLEPGESHSIRYETDSEFLMLKSLPYDPKEPDTFPYPVPDA
jgi:dTDP-4-dehydrorhamnose 3,5-epimerase-like enzyme